MQNDKFDRDEAHRRIQCLEGLFDQYNEHGFLDTSFPMLKVYQEMVQEALSVLKYLHEQEPNSEANNAYLLFCRKLSMRLSCRIHEGRKETDLEMHEFLARYE